MEKRKRELGKAIEALRVQLYSAVAGNPANISKKQVQELSIALDRLIVEWVKN